MSAKDDVTFPSETSSKRRATEHFVQFYEDETCLVEAVSHFIGSGLDSDGAGILIATEAHRQPVTERLAARGHDVAALEEAGRLVTLDAAETLNSFMVDGWPEPGRFDDVIGRVVRQATAGGRRPMVRAFGEMVALLWAEGRRDAALALEKLWNGLMQRHELSLFCAYPLREFDREADGKSLVEICAEHGHVLPAESFAGVAATEDHLRLIMQLQEKSIALDREAARAKELEETLRRREKDLTDLLENTTEAVMDIDPDGRMRWANRSCQSLLGVTAGTDEHVGRPVQGYLCAPETFDDVWSKLVRGQPVRNRRLEIASDDGTVKSVRLHSGVLRMVGKSIHMRWFIRSGDDATGPSVN